VNLAETRPWRGFGEDECPLSDTLRLLGGKHTTMILHCLVGADLHFLELCRALPHVSRKVLTDELKALIDGQIVLRTEEGDALGRVRYGLSQRGRDLGDILGRLYDWAVDGGKAGQARRWSEA
jgi:DNA-binding HxlR family transcriptional regulator